MIHTAVVGTNADLIAEVAKLYLKRGDRILDATYGRGVFWSKIDALPYTLVASDIAPQGAWVERNDFRKLSYADALFDVVVLDPPYMHGGRTIKASIRRCYKNGARSRKDASHRDILQLYADGMLEAKRVLKPGGLLWVKCQDEIESGRQHWSHIEVCQLADKLGYVEAVDLFVLVQQTKPARRQATQYHARKNHSYLWIFRKGRA